MNTVTLLIQEESNLYDYCLHQLDEFKNATIFAIDRYLENEVNKFVTPHVLPKIFLQWDTVDSFLLQKAGVDLVAKYKEGDKLIFVDNKCASRYVNNELTTFALELTYQKQYDNEEVIGWFLNDTILTDYYLLFWLKATPFGKVTFTYKQNGVQKKKVIPVFCSEMIEYIDFALVSKDKIQSYLDTLNMTREHLLQSTKILRNDNKKRESKNIEYKDKFVRFDLSKIETHPLNLLVDKDKLIELAEKSGRISAKEPHQVCAIPKNENRAI